MATTLFQIMIRIKESFVPLLKEKLKLKGGGTVSETDVYLTSRVKDRTEKVTQTEGNLWHEFIAKDDHVFRIIQEVITPKQRDGLLSRQGEQVTLHRQREHYIVHGVDVAIDRIEELGTFLELEGPDRQAVESIATTLGFSSSQYIEHPYDWLRR